MRLSMLINKRLFYAILLLPALLLGSCCIPSCGKTAKIQKNMEEGLKKIYGKEFVVSRPHETGNPGFGYHYEAKAYPKDNPEIKFTVAYDMNQDGKFGEDYLQQLWMYQGKHDLEKLLRSQYGDDFLIYSYSFGYYNRDFKNLNYIDVLKASDGWVNLSIKYIVFTDQKIDKKTEAETIHRIFDVLMLKNHLRTYRLIVKYSPMKYKSNGYYEHQDLTTVKSMDQLYQEGIISNFVDLENLDIKKAGIVNVDANYILSLFK